MLNLKICRLLCCPYDGGELIKTEDRFVCLDCKRLYPVIDDIPYFLPDQIMKTNRRAVAFFKKNNMPENIKKSATLSEDSFSDWKEKQIEAKWDFIAIALKKLATIGRGETFLPSDEKAFTLDIGCGKNPRGSVNMDIFLPNPIPSNFILASAELIPFKPRSFDIVYSVHVIEHLINPLKFINKQVEISKNKVYIVMDNSEWLGTIWMRLTNRGYLFCKQHYYQWTKEYIENLTNRIGLQTKIKLINFNPSLITDIISFPGRVKWLKNLFYIDIFVVISK
jgi:hypothetical protein